MRDLHTHLRLIGAGLAASIGLFTLGAAATPSFAATSSLPDVSPVTCPAGLTCTGDSSPGSSGVTTDHHAKDKKAPKPKHHKPAPKPKHDPKAPQSHAGVRTITDTTNTDPGGVKWH